MSEVKYAYRLAPCSAYDIEAMESWLEDMARSGLILSQEGIFVGFFTFERGTPREIRYRLTPALKKQSAMDPNTGEPFHEEVDIYQAMGWQYMLRAGDFFIYATEDPSAEEINTDPEVQALALKVLAKRQRKDLFWSALLIGILFCFDGRIGLSYPLRMAISVGTPVALAGYAWALAAIVLPMVQLVKINGLIKRIKSGESLNRKKDWRKGAWIRQLREPVFFLLTLVVMYACFGYSFRAIAQQVPLAEFPEDPPFLTLQDLSSGGEYQEIWESQNHARKWSDWLFPENYEWFEYSRITTPEGEQWTGTLYVSYHEALSPALARQLAKELLDAASEGKHFEKIEELALDAEGVTGYAYVDQARIPTVLLVCENIVIEAQVQIRDQDNQSLQPWWIQEMVQLLLRGNNSTNS